MRLGDFLAILIVCAIGGFLFACSSMGIFNSIGLSSLLFIAGLSGLNYLNHGKFHPFIRT